MSVEIACPLCDHEFDLLTAISSDADQRALQQFLQACYPIADRLLRYFTLFTPAKQRLTLRKQFRLMRELIPDLDRRAITHRGCDWQAPMGMWAQAIDQMLAQRDVHTLELPLKSHAYLYTVLASMADKAQAQQERLHEQAKRDALCQASVQVRGQTMSMGEGLQVMFGGKDPALAKLDDDSRKAVPMPESVRARLNSMKRGQA